MVASRVLPLAGLPKMIDHAARLDDDGYHRVKPAKKAYPEAKFVGETRMVHDDDDGVSLTKHVGTSGVMIGIAN